jgi:hypothetical protein
MKQSSGRFYASWRGVAEVTTYETGETEYLLEELCGRNTKK